MTALALALAAFFAVLLCLVSRRFSSRFEGRERVAMNWSLDGKPNSYASPRMALSLTPVIGTVVLLALAGLAAFAAPPDDMVPAIAVIAFTGLVFAGIHVAHLHFADRAAALEDAPK